MSAGTIPRFAWPIEVANGTTDRVEFDVGGGAVSANLIPGGADVTAFWRNDATAADLCQMLDVGLTAAAGGPAYQCSLLATGVLRITSDAQFTIHAGAAGTTADRLWFGWNAGNRIAAWTGAVWQLDGDFQTGHTWWPERTDLQYFIEDSERLPAYSSSMTRSMNGRIRVARWASRTEREILIDLLPDRKVLTAAESRTQEAFERFYAAMSQGTRFEFCPDWTVPATYATYQVPVGEWIQRFPCERTPGVLRRWNLRFPMQAYVV